MRVTRALTLATLLATLTTAVAVTATATPAAAAPPIEGYVWGDQPLVANYFPATGYEYNSAGGLIEITRNLPGSYLVRFHDMAGAGGVAHASAYGSNHICTVNAYGARGRDEVVHVRCHDTAGNPVDTRFIASVTNRQPAGGGVSFGYLWNDNPVPPAAGHVVPAQWSYDSAGQPIVVHRIAVGRYQVKLGAFAQDSAGAWARGFLTATAHGSAARHCQILDPAIVPDAALLHVSCFDDTGFNVDTRFTLTYARGVTALGAAAPHSSATVDQSAAVPVVTGWTNPGGAPAATELAVGSYRVSFPGAAAAGGHAVGSVMGTPPAFCNIQSWWPLGTGQQVWIRCYDGNVGIPTPAVLYNVGFLA